MAPSNNQFGSRNNHAGSTSHDGYDGTGFYDNEYHEYGDGGWGISI